MLSNVFYAYSRLKIKIQYNLDYPECSGLDKNARLIESTDNQIQISDTCVCTNKLGLIHHLNNYAFNT